ncbi:MAG: hypothetical protein ACTSX9_05835 [Candidatus Njordarchaeales archaeon]
MLSVFSLILLIIATTLLLNSISKKRELSARLSAAIASLFTYRGAFLFSMYYSYLDSAVMFLFALLTSSITFIIILLKVLFDRFLKDVKNSLPIHQVFLRNGYWEIARKSFHSVALLLLLPPQILWSLYISFSLIMELLSGKGLPLNYLAFIKYMIIIITGSLLIYFFLLEVIRIYFNLNIFPETLLRPHEKRYFATYFYTATSLFFIATLFPLSVVARSIIAALVYDALAAIFGKITGKRIIIKDRTLEGILAGALGTFITLLIVPHTPILISIIAIAGLVFVDILNAKIGIDDNLIFPLIIAVIFQTLNV